jgi:nitroimidazol reductase NimA-like FMN-containing flavoprotein (pyridoxamine 5'-phosphate oxidase superfamily)
MVERAPQDEGNDVVKEITRPRRIDRAMPDDAQIEAFLQQAPFGFLAMSVEDRPYVAPKLFWFDKNTQRIYFHSAKEGRTRDSLLRNPRVCFSAAELGEVVPARKACDVGVNYASICIFGTARLVESDEEKIRGLRGLVGKFVPDPPDSDYDSNIDPKELDNTAVYSIEIDAWSGKQR